MPFQAILCIHTNMAHVCTYKLVYVGIYIVGKKSKGVVNIAVMGTSKTLFQLPRLSVHGP